MFRKIPKNVVILGFVSLFNDIASEMIYPLIPLFLSVVLGAPASVIGLIEGIAEATASIMRFVSGYISDRAQKRKIFVTLGYSFSAISKPLIGLAISWHFVLFARFLDRFGKGVRTAARDSLLLQSTEAKNKGLIFGFHRAMDSAGAVLGPLIAALIIFLYKDNIAQVRNVFFIAFIPAVLGILLLIFIVKERKQIITKEKIKIKLKWRGLNPGFQLFFIITMIFSLGNSSDVFLILRAKNLGFTLLLTILVYALYNLSYSVFSTPGGAIADKIGARKVFAAGLGVFALVYFAFGILHNPFWLWLLFPIYGIYIAFTDGVSRAYIGEFVEQKESGTYFGLYQMGMALCGFFASLIGGILWSAFGAQWTFFYGAGMAVLALVVFSYGKIIRKI